MSVQSSGTSGFNTPTYSSVSKISSGVAPSANYESTSRVVKSGLEVKRLQEQGVPLSIGEGQLVKAIDRAIKALEGPSTAFEMSYHEQTHAIVVKVLNKETGEVIREIPPEKTLDLVAKMMEIAGILVDEKV
ncbi:flagellar protein FlaG [Paenibacillus turpanensis]|uniref:flagellar protein FlaG n=1 Tax=Paenibacillus turpanensis TaxID=2689078 RepID=UPI003133101A